VELTIPLTVSASDKIENIRKKASGKCLSASSGEIYQFQDPHGRRVNSKSYSNSI
jgi:hypothetical protein